MRLVASVLTYRSRSSAFSERVWDAWHSGLPSQWTLPDKWAYSLSGASPLHVGEGDIRTANATRQNKTCHSHNAGQYIQQIHEHPL